MAAPTQQEVHAQLDATIAEVGKMHEILLARFRHGDPNPFLFVQHIRDLMDMELRLRELATHHFQNIESTE